MGILDSVQNPKGPYYSVYIDKLIDKGELPKEVVEKAVAAFKNGDFGNVAAGQARVFNARLNRNDDRDIWGKYDSPIKDNSSAGFKPGDERYIDFGDIMVYYNAKFDQLTILTENEFLNHYFENWVNKDRAEAHNVRYKTSKSFGNVRSAGATLSRAQVAAIVEKVRRDMNVEKKDLFNKKRNRGIIEYLKKNVKVYPLKGALHSLKKMQLENYVSKRYPELDPFIGTAYDYLKKITNGDIVKLLNAIHIFGQQNGPNNRNQATALEVAINNMDVGMRDSVKR